MALAKQWWKSATKRSRTVEPPTAISAKQSLPAYVASYVGVVGGNDIPVSVETVPTVPVPADEVLNVVPGAYETMLRELTSDYGPYSPALHARTEKSLREVEEANDRKLRTLRADLAGRLAVFEAQQLEHQPEDDGFMSLSEGGYDAMMTRLGEIEADRAGAIKAQAQLRFDAAMADPAMSVTIRKALGGEPRSLIQPTIGEHLLRAEARPQGVHLGDVPKLLADLGRSERNRAACLEWLADPNPDDLPVIEMPISTTTRLPEYLQPYAATGIEVEGEGGPVIVKPEPLSVTEQRQTIVLELRRELGGWDTPYSPGHHELAKSALAVAQERLPKLIARDQTVAARFDESETLLALDPSPPATEEDLLQARNMFDELSKLIRSGWDIPGREREVAHFEQLQRQHQSSDIGAFFDRMGTVFPVLDAAALTSHVLEAGARLQGRARLAAAAAEPKFEKALSVLRDANDPEGLISQLEAMEGAQYGTTKMFAWGLAKDAKELAPTTKPTMRLGL